MADMTLEQVRDWHLSHTKYVHLPITNAAHQELADAIDAAIKQHDQDAKLCVWSEDEDGNWETGCGHMFVFNEGTPYDNEMGFCCYCGHKLDQITQEIAAQENYNGV